MPGHDLLPASMAYLTAASECCIVVQTELWNVCLNFSRDNLLTDRRMPSSSHSRAKIDRPWGKLQHGADGQVTRAQSLESHSADVAATLVALCKTRGIRDRLATVATPLPVDDVLLARLGYLALLHDCGKVNHGFQARQVLGAPMVGHIATLAPVLGDHADNGWFTLAAAALGLDRIVESWGDGAELLLDAIFSHHGVPWPKDASRPDYRVHWKAQADGYDPIAELRRLRETAEEAYSEAFSADAPPLPTNPLFIHAVAGLIQLADWVASSGWESAPAPDDRERWAEERLREIGLDPDRSRATLLAREFLRFENVFGYTPYPHQEKAGEIEGRCVILEAETGSGKTEAALWRFLRLFTEGAVDGLYFALPTRTAAVQLHRRIEKMAKDLWGEDAPPVVLAVPGYLDAPGASRQFGASDRSVAGSIASGELPPAEDPLDESEGDARSPGVWAAEHPKRYFAAAISVGTIDQALLATMRVKHAHLRGAALMRHLLVVDEVHASDAYMRQYLMQLLRDHVATGGHALLLSATLGAAARAQLLTAARGGLVQDAVVPSFHEATVTEYPLLTSIGRERVVSASVKAENGASHKRRVKLRLESWLDNPEAIAATALRAAAAGARVLIVRNTVAGAVAAQRALESLAQGERRQLLFAVGGVPTLHHSRFAREDRRRLDAEIERQFGRDRAAGGVVAVGTQTLEQSLDIDADYLITDLCPSDVLLQRLGRLHRHERANRPIGWDAPQAIVLVPEGGLAPFLKSRRPGGLRHGLGHTRWRDGLPKGVYQDLAVLEATRRFIIANPVWETPAMNRRIVEAAVHEEAIEALLDSLPASERAEWAEHHDRILGSDFAKGKLANNGTLRRHHPFRHQDNVGFDDRIGTRLGLQDLVISLPDGTIGPFGEMSRIAIPVFWLLDDGDEQVDLDQMHTPDIQGGGPVPGFRFGLGTLVFDYGPHGLSRVFDV